MPYKNETVTYYPALGRFGKSVRFQPLLFDWSRPRGIEKVIFVRTSSVRKHDSDGGGGELK